MKSTLAFQPIHFSFSLKYYIPNHDVNTNLSSIHHFELEYIRLNQTLSHMWKTAKTLSYKGSNQTSSEHIVPDLIMKLHIEIIEWKGQQEAKSKLGLQEALTNQA